MPKSIADEKSLIFLISNTGDSFAQEIREALYHLGEITGDGTKDEVLGKV